VCGGGSCARSRRLLREQTAHFLAAPLSEGIEALAAQLQQLVAFGVAQFLAVHKVVGALVVAGDAVEGELPTIRLTRSV
jgi:hypothetical protein